MRNRNHIITTEFLESRAERAIKAGFKKQKWVEFCERMLAEGFTCSLYEARETVSKYINVQWRGRTFKVRYSDHRPNKTREKNGDCDFFVGVTHLGITRTDDAIKAVLEWRQNHG